LDRPGIWPAGVFFDVRHVFTTSEQLWQDHYAHWKVGPAPVESDGAAKPIGEHVVQVPRVIAQLLVVIVVLLAQVPGLGINFSGLAIVSAAQTIH
jgi:hypothetical protein